MFACQSLLVPSLGQLERFGFPDIKPIVGIVKEIVDSMFFGYFEIGGDDREGVVGLGQQVEQVGVEDGYATESKACVFVYGLFDP